MFIHFDDNISTIDIRSATKKDEKNAMHLIITITIIIIEEQIVNIA